MSVTEPPTPAVHLSKLSVSFDDRVALHDCTLTAGDRAVTAIIGPTGSGKTTLLRAINRMVEVIPGAKLSGDVMVHGRSIYVDDVDPLQVRREVGMVFSEPDPFPRSIYENVALAARMHRLARNGPETDLIVEDALRRSHLWPVVKNRLSEDARRLSLGDQQKLCLARVLALNPKVILFNDPTSVLDPLAAAGIEEVISTLKSMYCLMIVTQSVAQAARISESTVLIDKGQVIEQSPTELIFTSPRDQRTEDYLTGRV